MSPILVLMLKSPVDRTQVLRWSTAVCVVAHFQVGVRAVSPMGDAQVQGSSLESRAFCGVTACFARMARLCQSLLFWHKNLPSCMRACWTASLHVLACRTLVVRAARSVRDCYCSSGRPGSPPSSLISAISPLAISYVVVSPVLRHVQQVVRRRGSAGAVNSCA